MKQPELNFEAMELPSARDLTLLVYTAPRGSSTSDSLKLLASWAATTEQNNELAKHRTAAERSTHLARRHASYENNDQRAATSPPRTIDWFLR